MHHVCNPQYLDNIITKAGPFLFVIMKGLNKRSNLKKSCLLDARCILQMTTLGMIGSIINGGCELYSWFRATLPFKKLKWMFWGGLSNKFLFLNRM